jgi:hypothetical protein
LDSIEIHGPEAELEKCKPGTKDLGTKYFAHDGLSLGFQRFCAEPGSLDPSDQAESIAESPVKCSTTGSTTGSMEGTLEKKGTSGWKSWQKRHFVLSEGGLFYSDGPGKPLQKSKGLSLAGAVVTRASDATSAFVVSVDSKELHLRSPNGPADTACWIAAIESVPGTQAEGEG